MARKGGYRSYVDVDSIPTTNLDLVSTGSCASLVQHFTRVGATSNWKEGARVRGHKTIKRGTAIATFENGVYPNKSTGNHAALYVSQDTDGIWVVEQWKSLERPQKRHIEWQGKKADGTYEDPSNNGDAFSIIEL